MPLLLALFIWCCLTTLLTAAETRTDAERAGLFGPVLTVNTVTTLPTRDGERIVSHYNAHGNETETILYTGTGVLAEKSVHSYNPKEKRTETITSDANGALLRKTLYLFDFHGRLNEQTILDDVGLIERTTYVYDSQRNSVDETTGHVRRSLTVRTIRFYDATGKETATTTFSRDGSATKTTFRYDDKGNVITRTVSASDGTVIDRLTYVYEFDATGSWITQTELICAPTSELVASNCARAATVVRTITYGAHEHHKVLPRKETQATPRSGLRNVLFCSSPLRTITLW